MLPGKVERPVRSYISCCVILFVPHICIFEFLIRISEEKILCINLSKQRSTVLILQGTER